MSHDWSWVVLKVMHIPQVFANVVRALYHICSASVYVGGVEASLFWAPSGLLQGCPLSGMLFALCLSHSSS